MNTIRLVAQKDSLPIKNYDECSSLKQSYRKHGVLLGEGCKRGLIIGRSGCGKTNVMVSLIEHENGLRFKNVYVYSKTLNQPKYAYLRTLLKPIKGVGYFEYDNDANIIAPRNAKTNSIIIFDDIVCDNQSIVREYFSFGRHNNIDCFYLCQSYSSIPKRLIRDNSNMIVCFLQDDRNLKHIYHDHVSVDMSFELFKRLCSSCWGTKYGFLVIDKDCELNSGRYRKGFDSYFYI